jgi:DegV family protein with EDD domain
MNQKNNKVAVITDSMSCIPRGMLEQLNISVVPITIHFDGQNYRDLFDLTADQAYELFLRDPDEFKTSPPSVGQFLDAYTTAAKAAENILCITLSSKLSACYKIACIARDEARQQIPGVNIGVLDSTHVTASQGFVVLAAARSAADGKDLKAVIRATEDMMQKTTFLMALDTIEHVYRTGRIPKVVARLGSIMSVKPILTFKSGAVSFAGMTRKHDHSLDRIIQLFKHSVGDKPVHVAVMHAYAEGEARKLKERIAAEFNCKELWVTELSPVMGYAVGTGTVGFAWYAG